MSSLLSNIVILLKVIGHTSYDMNIYEYKHVYREANRTAIVWPKKVLVLQIQNFGCLISLKMLLTLVLKIIVGLYLIVCVESFLCSFFL